MKKWNRKQAFLITSSYLAVGTIIVAIQLPLALMNRKTDVKNAPKVIKVKDEQPKQDEVSDEVTFDDVLENGLLFLSDEQLDNFFGLDNTSNKPNTNLEFLKNILGSGTFSPAISNLINDLLNHPRKYVELIKKIRKDGIFSIDDKSTASIMGIINDVFKRQLNTDGLKSIFKKLNNIANKYLVRELYYKLEFSEAERNLIKRQDPTFLNDPPLDQANKAEIYKILTSLFEKIIVEQNDIASNQKTTPVVTGAQQETEFSKVQTMLEQSTTTLNYLIKLQKRIAMSNDQTELKITFSEFDYQQLKLLMQKMINPNSQLRTFLAKHGYKQAMLDNIYQNLNNATTKINQMHKWHKALTKLVTFSKENGNEAKILVEYQIIGIQKDDLQTIKTFASNLSTNLTMGNLMQMVHSLPTMFNSKVSTFLQNHREILDLVMKLVGQSLDDNIFNLIKKILYEGISKTNSLETIVNKILAMLEETFNMDMSQMPIKVGKTFFKDIMKKVVKMILNPLSDTNPRTEIARRIGYFENEIEKIKTYRQFGKNLYDEIMKYAAKESGQNFMPARSQAHWTKLTKYYLDNYMRFLAKDEQYWHHPNVDAINYNLKFDANEAVNLAKLMILDETEISKFKKLAKKIRESDFISEKQRAFYSDSIIDGYINAYSNSFSNVNRDQKWNALWSYVNDNAPELHHNVNFEMIKDFNQNEANFLRSLLATGSIPQQSLDKIIIFSDDNQADEQSKFIHKNKIYHIFPNAISDKAMQEFYLFKNLDLTKSKPDLKLTIDRLINSDIVQKYTPELAQTMIAKSTWSAKDKISLPIKIWPTKQNKTPIIKEINHTNANGAKSRMILRWEQGANGLWNIVVRATSENRSDVEDDVIFKITKSTGKSSKQISNGDWKTVNRTIAKQLNQYLLTSEFTDEKFVNEVVKAFKKASHQPANVKLLDQKWTEFKTALNDLWLPKEIAINEELLKNGNMKEFLKLEKLVNDVYLRTKAPTILIGINDDQMNIDYFRKNGKLYIFMDTSLTDELEDIIIFPNFFQVPHAKQKISYTIGDLRSKNGDIPYRNIGGKVLNWLFDIDYLNSYDLINNSKDFSNREINFSNQTMMTRNLPWSRQKKAIADLKNLTKRTDQFLLHNQTPAKYTVSLSPDLNSTNNHLTLDIDVRNKSGEDDQIVRISNITRTFEDQTIPAKARELLARYQSYQILKNLSQMPQDDPTKPDSNDELLKNLQRQLLVERNKREIIAFEDKYKMNEIKFRYNRIFRGDGLFNATSKEIQMFAIMMAKIAIVLPEKIFEIIAETKTGNGILDFFIKITNYFGFTDDIIASIPEVKKIINSELLKTLQTLDFVGTGELLSNLFNLNLQTVTADDIDKIMNQLFLIATPFKFGVINDLQTTWANISLSTKKSLLLLLQKGFQIDSEHHTKLNYAAFELFNTLDIKLDKIMLQMLFGKSYLEDNGLE